MTMALLGLFACYAAGILLPPCLPGRPRAQNLVANGLAVAASLFGILLGLAGLLADQPLTAALPSTLPFLVFAVRIDPLAAFFVLTISLAGLAVSIYALGYLAEFYGRAPVGLMGALSAVEGWRGEILYLVMAGEEGQIHRCKVRDPSFVNWPAIQWAVLGNIIPDFPLINKSFNLSYAGNDL